MAGLDAVRVVFEHTPIDSFFNINCARDLEAAEQIAGSAGGS